MNFFTKKKILLSLLSVFILSGFFGAASSIQAAPLALSVNVESRQATKKCPQLSTFTPTSTGLLGGTTAECQACGDCSLCDFVSVFARIASFILAIVGGLALIIFIWGGLVLLTSGGSTEKVAQGKKILTGAVIGVLIILGGWQIVNTLLSYIGLSGQFASPQDWAKGNCEQLLEQKTRGIQLPQNNPKK